MLLYHPPAGLAQTSATRGYSYGCMSLVQALTIGQILISIAMSATQVGEAVMSGAGTPSALRE
jgi:hypothetical protein